MVPNGWQSKILNELLDFKNGMNTDKSQYGSGHKFINVMDIFNNDILNSSNIIGYVKATQKQIAVYRIKFGDIFFNRTSETFNDIAMSAVYIDDEFATFGGFVIRGRPKTQELDVDFCVYVFQAENFRKQAIRMGQGAIRSNIGQKDLGKIKLKIPPITEQRKIAKILSTWDKAISTIEALIDNSKQQKKALMQQLLTGKKRLLDNKGKIFEGDWKKVRLSNLADIVMGSSPKSSTYNDNLDGLPLIQGNADIKKRKSVPRIHTSQITKQCHIGDILLSVRAPVGTVAKSLHHACIGRGISAIKANSKNSQEFIYQWLLWFEPKWAKFSQGSTFEAVNSNDIKSLSFMVPLITEQQKIASVLTNAGKEIALLEKQLADLKLEKKALMQQLLTGKRRVVVDKHDENHIEMCSGDQ